MERINLFFAKYSTPFLIILLLLLTIPTFWRMLHPGIFSMSDFHVFRLYEYDKCLADLQIPCRWAPDAAYEYGEPLFNFYAQAPYVFGEFFRALGLTILNSIKALFIASLALSAMTMFLLSKQLWKSNAAAIVSSLIYTYAPYRAVDIYVRGALPEALAFIFFPLIIYFFNNYVLKKRLFSLLLFGLSYALLILTHNLSALMFLPILTIWAIYLLTQNRAWNLIYKFVLISFLTFGLSAFYVLPMVLESNLISIGKTTSGYYDYVAHFVTLKQLFISRYWGYGASLWGEDDRLSLSVGHLQWIFPLLVFLLIAIQKRVKKNTQFLILLFLGWLALFLTHNKSTFIWTALYPMSYIQFPWRFLGSAVFAFAVASGAFYTLQIKNITKATTVIIVAAILIVINIGFFHEDIWYNYSDRDQFSGSTYEWQTSSAIGDFWPKTARVTPTSPAPKDPMVFEGSEIGRLIEKRSSSAVYRVSINSDRERVQFPITYFPGWIGSLDNREIEVYPSGDFGLITTDIKNGTHTISLHFKNTPARTIGNIISLISVLIFILLISKFRNTKLYV